MLGAVFVRDFPLSALMPTLSLPSSSSAPRALRLRRADASTAARVAGIVVFALLAALGAQVRLQLWEVPFTLQTLAVYGAGLFLGARSGALSMALYLALGLVFPVFVDGGTGVAYLMGATGGYLVALPLAAAVTGALTEHRSSLAASVGAGLAGMAVIFTLGALWLHAVAGHASWGVTLARGVVPFLAADLLKLFVAALALAGARRLG